MKLYEFLKISKKEKRILATSDVKRTNSIIRSFENVTGSYVCNVMCVDIRNLIVQLFLYYVSEESYNSEFNIISDAESAMLFRSVMLDNVKNLKYFKDEKILTIATCNEIYNKISLIRGCGWNGKEDDLNPRIADLKYLIGKYEEALKSNKVFDQNSILDFLLDKLNVKDASVDIKKCFNAEISYLIEDTDRLTGKEIDFLNKIAELSGNSNDPALTFIEKPDSGIIKQLSPKISFFKGYGSFNETSYIANDILENKIPLSDVTVLYTSDSQINAIDSAFTGNNLKVSYVSGRSLKDNAFIALARRILSWAKDDFSEKSLAYIFESSALYNEYDDSGNKTNAIGDSKYFDHVLNARNRRIDGFSLGWGYERNLNFVNNELFKTTDERTKKALEIHEDLLSIFGDEKGKFDEKNAKEPIAIYEKLLDIVNKYKSRIVDAKDGIAALNNLKNTIALEKRRLSLVKSIDFIDELLMNIKGCDDSLPDAAEIVHVSDWKNIHRKNIYFIGLSLKEMQKSSTESPILSDEEMESWLNQGYKPTIANETVLRDLNIYRTLSTFEGDKLSLGYSFYDTVLFADNSPSVFYRDSLKSCNKKLEDVKTFVYGNPTEGVIEKPSGIPVKDNCYIKLKGSNSTIEILLDCPKKYYYSQIEKIPDNEYLECKEDCWLDSLHYGSLFHYVAQQYVEEIFIRPSNEAYILDVDEDCLFKKIDEKANEMQKVYPAPSLEQKDYEINNFKEMCKKYFEKVHHIMNTNDLGWRMLMTEKRFEKELYDVKDYLLNDYSFEFNGEIDRVDYKIDDNEEKIYLRIIDYKTGKFDSKNKDLKLGKVIQHAIYKKGLEDVALQDIRNEIIKLENNKAVEKYEIVFTDFTYHFPKEPDNWQLKIDNDDIEDVNLTRLRATLTAIKEMCEYPDHLQLYEKISEYAVSNVQKDSKLPKLYDSISRKEKLSSDETRYCKYCSYKDICPNMRGGKIR